MEVAWLRAMKFFKFIFVFISFLLSQSGYEIAQKINLKPHPNDVKAKLIMTLEDRRGNQMESIIKSYTKDNGKKQIMWFLYPLSDRGISLYKIEKDDGKDEMKMWLPGFNRIRKITSRKRTEKFMHSDLTYEDLYNRELDDYSYSLEILDDSTYILTSMPKKDIESSYSKHISWIDVESLIVIKEESYSKADILVKTKEFKFIKIEEFNMVKEIYVLDDKTKHKTYLRFEDILVNSGIEDSEFHEMNLRRMPIDE